MRFIECKHCGGRAREIASGREREMCRCAVCRRITIIDHEALDVGIKFMAYNHQNKADALVAALSEKYIYHQNPLPDGYVRFMFADSDVLGRGGQMRRMQKRGVRRFFVYPHAARPSLINAHWREWEGTTAQFVVNEYHAEVLRRYGYSKPIETMGWHLSPVEAFKPRETVKRVLFAPIHPRNAPVDRKANRAAFDRLYKHALSGEIELTVRYIGLMVDNGLEEKPGVQYVKGTMDNSTVMMNAADVVIAHQTFAWLAVARGVPCVMFAEDMPCHFRRSHDLYDDVECWNEVAPLFRYPLDLLCEDDTMELLTRAARSEAETADWKRRMIGDPFDSALFVKKVERYL